MCHIFGILTTQAIQVWWWIPPPGQPHHPHQPRHPRHPRYPHHPPVTIKVPVRQKCFLKCSFLHIKTKSLNWVKWSMKSRHTVLPQGTAAHGLTGSTARLGTARRHRYGTRQLRRGHRGENTHSSENILWTNWCEHEVTSNSQVCKEFRGVHPFRETNLFCYIFGECLLVKIVANKM